MQLRQFSEVLIIVLQNIHHHVTHKVAVFKFYIKLHFDNLFEVYCSDTILEKSRIEIFARLLFSSSNHKGQDLANKEGDEARPRFPVSIFAYNDEVFSWHFWKQLQIDALQNSSLIFEGRCFCHLHKYPLVRQFNIFEHPSFYDNKLSPWKLPSTKYNIHNKTFN